MSWRGRRVSEMAKLINGYPFDSTDFSPTGDVPLVRIRDITADTFETYVSRENTPTSAMIRDDDVVIGMDGDFNVALWQRGPAALNQRVCLLRANEHADARYLAYSLPPHLQIINDLTYSTTVKHLSGSQVLHIRFSAPPVDEQRAIADYLDQETAQIDALVAKQEALLSLLAERKRSILDHVLADIHGNDCRLRWLFRPSDAANMPDEEVLSVYRDHGVIPKSSRSDNFNKTPENVDRYLLVRPNDLVVNKMKAWQGSLGISGYRGIVSGDYEVLRPTTNDLDPAFAHFVLRSPQMILEYRVRSRGIRPSQWRLYWQDLADIAIGVPPLDEQRRAATRIKKETDAIDSLITKAEEHIALAKERRAALITAAVTGQFDVRTARKAG